MASIVKVYPDLHTWTEAAAAEITELVKAAVAAKGFAVVGLSGGRTPVAVYQRLTQSPWREAFPWSKIYWLWVDERWVPPDHPDSNYGSAWKAMLSKVPIDGAKVHRMLTEGMAPHEAAAAYEEKLRKLFQLQGSGIDLAVLGMGTDGHTASLFPGSPALNEATRWIAATESPAGIRRRITMTLPLLYEVETLLFLVAGEDKKNVLDAVIHGGPSAQEYPAGKVMAAKQTIWIIDDEAAGAKTAEVKE